MASKSIAFFTTGDTRAVKGANEAIVDGKKKTVTMSEMWKLRAQSLAGQGQTHGVGSVAAAIQKLKGLESGAKLTAVYFVGHGFGNNDGGFFLAGKPQGADDFSGGLSQTISFSARKEMDEFCKGLAPYLDRDTKVEILFLSCYSGQGKFSVTFYKALRDLGVKKLKVGAYKDYYETRFNLDAKGNITGWADRVTDQAGKVVLKPGTSGIPPFQVVWEPIDVNSADPLEGL